jgi:FtsZ-interacting cell division protein YlmF
MNFLKKKKTPKTKDILVQLELKDTSNANLKEIADELTEGIPYVINFNGISNSDANKAVAFLTGVCYMLGGEPLLISEKIVLFGDENMYNDGSLKEYLKDFF